jgi:RNA 2',3'-cyclic 3'-phosphodiesterase
LRPSHVLSISRRFPCGWAGAGSFRPPDGLSRLQQEVVKRLHPLGFEPERRPFSAHLTIARVKDVPRAAARDARALVAAARVPDASCLITRVTLFRSHLSPKGSRYEALAHGELSAS